LAAFKTIVNELARALVLLALFLFLLGVPAALATTPPTVVQQASALLSGQPLCGRGQGPVACHAPNSCCRPGHALVPPRGIELAPAYAHVTVVVYSTFRDGTAVAGTTHAFQSRAPPV
jgi:hypothetical protein